MAEYVAKVRLRCSTGTKTVEVPGPSSAAAVRKGLDYSAHGCVKTSVEIVKRGADAGLPNFGRARRRRRRR